MQPLQSILANLKVTKKTRLEDLSNEAGRIISHLPDLSFMKKKVLMFPLKQNNLWYIAIVKEKLRCDIFIFFFTSKQSIVIFSPKNGQTFWMSMSLYGNFVTI